MSPPPPYSFGKPMPVWPVAAISTTTSFTRSRKSSWLMGLGLLEDEAYSARLARTRSRTSAYSPSRKAAQAGHVDLRRDVERRSVGRHGRLGGHARTRSRGTERAGPWRGAHGRAKKFGVIQ